MVDSAALGMLLLAPLNFRDTSSSFASALSLSHVTVSKSIR